LALANVAALASCGADEHAGKLTGADFLYPCRVNLLQ
jgi:hypothetical protein